MTLKSLAADPTSRAKLLDACVQTLHDEVHKKKGAIAYAVKKAYDGVGRLEGGNLIRNVFDKLIDEFIDAIEPHYNEFMADGAQGTFENYIAGRREDVAKSLLVVTDRERDRVDSKILVIAYSSLRGTALKLVRDSAPAVGAMLARQLT